MEHSILGLKEVTNDLVKFLSPDEATTEDANNSA